MLEGYEQPAVGNVYEFGADIDVAVYSPQAWQAHLEAHTLWAVPFQFYPARAIFVQHRRFPFNLRVQKLRRSAMKNLKKNASQARGLWRDGDIRKAKKRIRYCLRHAEFACQLARTGRIDDWAASNELGNQLLAHHFETWAEFSRFWEPAYDASVTLLAQLTRAYREIELLPGHPVLNFLRAFGLDGLTRMLSIQIFEEDNKVLSLLWFDPIQK